MFSPKRLTDSNIFLHPQILLFQQGLSNAPVGITAGGVFLITRETTLTVSQICFPKFQWHVYIKEEIYITTQNGNLPPLFSRRYLEHSWRMWWSSCSLQAHPQLVWSLLPFLVTEKRQQIIWQLLTLWWMSETKPKTRRIWFSFCFRALENQRLRFLWVSFDKCCVCTRNDVRASWCCLHCQFKICCRLRVLFSFFESK